MTRKEFEALPALEKIAILRDTLSMLKVFRAPCFGTDDRNKRMALIESKIDALEKETKDHGQPQTSKVQDRRQPERLLAHQ